MKLQGDASSSLEVENYGGIGDIELDVPINPY